MLIRIGLEHDNEARTLAWALDFPGCFAYGADEAEALLQLPGSLLQFDYWVRLHSDQPWFKLEDMDFHVDESFTCYVVPDSQDQYVVNAFFNDDTRPLSENELEQAIKVLTWQHQELQAGIEFAEPSHLDLARDGGCWSIEGILKHLARAEVWYLQVLGFDVLPPPENLSGIDQLEYSYQLVIKYLPEMVGSKEISQYSGESWTPRKFVRRLLWHRRDHIDQIKKLLGVPLA